MDNHPRSEPVQSEERPEPRRRKRWPTVVAVLIVAAAIGGIIAHDHFIGRFQRFEPFQMALKLIQNDAKVKEQLGAPVKDATSLLDRSLPSGSIYTAGDGGEATLLFKVSGPKGQADVLAKARRNKGKWDLNSVDLTLASGGKISVEVPGDAPAFVPGGAGGGAPVGGGPVGGGIGGGVGGGGQLPNRNPPETIPGKLGPGPGPGLKEPVIPGSKTPATPGSKEPATPGPSVDIEIPGP
jgi:hypothetical protein